MEELTNWWMCSDCQYVFKSKEVPETCPGCKNKCTFSDVSCYIPECGGPENLDMRLVAARSEESKKFNKKN